MSPGLYGRRMCDWGENCAGQQQVPRILFSLVDWLLP